VDGDAETMELKGRGGAGPGTTGQGNGTRGTGVGQEGPTIRPGLGRTGFGFKGVKRLGKGPHPCTMEPGKETTACSTA
jgi:hypothetical protein